MTPNDDEGRPRPNRTEYGAMTLGEAKLLRDVLLFYVADKCRPHPSRGTLRNPRDLARLWHRFDLDPCDFPWNPEDCGFDLPDVEAEMMQERRAIPGYAPDATRESSLEQLRIANDQLRRTLRARENKIRQLRLERDHRRYQANAERRAKESAQRQRDDARKEKHDGKANDDDSAVRGVRPHGGAGRIGVGQRTASLPQVHGADDSEGRDDEVGQCAALLERCEVQLHTARRNERQATEQLTRAQKRCTELRKEGRLLRDALPIVSAAEAWHAVGTAEDTRWWLQEMEGAVETAPPELLELARTASEPGTRRALPRCPRCGVIIRGAWHCCCAEPKPRERRCETCRHCDPDHDCGPWCTLHGLGTTPRGGRNCRDYQSKPAQDGEEKRNA